MYNENTIEAAASAFGTSTVDIIRAPNINRQPGTLLPRMPYRRIIQLAVPTINSQPGTLLPHMPYRRTIHIAVPHTYRGHTLQTYNHAQHEYYLPRNLVSGRSGLWFCFGSVVQIVRSSPKSVTILFVTHFADKGHLYILGDLCKSSIISDFDSDLDFSKHDMRSKLTNPNKLMYDGSG